MKIAYAPEYIHPLPDGHRFPMAKYELLHLQLLHEGIAEAADFFRPAPMPEEIILAVHTREYYQALQEGTIDRRVFRKTGFPYSLSLFQREVLITHGTVQAGILALDQGFTANIAGGTHHAYANHGEGFCLFNDIAVAAQYLLDTGCANRIAIIDLDVHQGNGTANIFRQEDRVFTFSMHGARNYPSPKEKSDWDIALEDGIEDAEYLETLDKALKHLERTRVFDFVFYQAGVDPLERDKLGKLSLSMAGLKARDEMVLRWAHKLGLPLTATMGGGYSPDLAEIVEAHTQTFRLAAHIYG